MFHKASLKLGLDRAVLAHAKAHGEDEIGGDGGQCNLAKPNSNKFELNPEDIDHLLKRGAYDVFRTNPEEEVVNEMTEADLDEILKRSSHNVVYGDVQTLASSALASSFSKASFVSVDNKEDVDLDDPDFWKKAIGFKEPVPEEQPAVPGGVILEEKRTRKKNMRYEPMTTDANFFRGGTSLSGM